MTGAADRRRLGQPDGWALVLGCTVGTGAAIARTVAAEAGLNVLGLHRGNHTDEAAALKAEVERCGRRCELIVADGGRLAALDALVAQAAALVGPGGLDLVVHSLADGSVAPIVPSETRKALHPKQVLKTFEIMAHSFLFWGQGLLAAGALSDGARLVALTNYLDESTVRGGAAIGPAKAALAAYVRFMASEMAAHGVTVYAVRYGGADTYAANHMPNYQRTLRRFAELSPMGRNVDVDDVAALVTLLLDRRTSFLNGGVLPFDGGERAAFLQHVFFAEASAAEQEGGA